MITVHGRSYAKWMYGRFLSVPKHVFLCTGTVCFLTPVLSGSSNKGLPRLSADCERAAVSASAPPAFN